MNKENQKEKFKKRAYTWVLDTVKTLDSLSISQSGEIIAKHFIRSTTSVGANYVEGQAAVSRKDFAHYMSIAPKSANESKYWPALLQDLGKLNNKKADIPLEEVQNISNILSAGIVTLRKEK